MTHKHRPGPGWKKRRLAVLKRDRAVCWICGQGGANTVDHVIPLSKGGTDTLANLRAAHQWCNYRRGANPPSAPVVTRSW